MTVWRAQDRLWRLTAVMGLAAALGLYALLLLSLPPVLIYPGQPACAPDFIPFFLATAWPPVLLWLLMLAWRHMAILWAALWALVGMTGLLLATNEATCARLPEDAALALGAALGAATLLGSQVWLAVEAMATRAPASAADDAVPGCAAPRLWRRAPLVWVLLVAVGGLPLLPSLFLVPLTNLWQIWRLFSVGPVHWVLTALEFLLVGGVFVLLWRELLISGRTWLWWLITWALCVPVVVALLPWVTVDVETWSMSFRLSAWASEYFVEAACFVMPFALFVPAQIWAALQARQLAPRRAHDHRAVDKYH